MENLHMKVFVTCIYNAKNEHKLGNGIIVPSIDCFVSKALSTESAQVKQSEVAVHAISQDELSKNLPTYLIKIKVIDLAVQIPEYATEKIIDNMREHAHLSSSLFHGDFVSPFSVEIIFD